MRRHLVYSFALAITLSLGAPNLIADGGGQGQGNGHGKSQGNGKSEGNGHDNGHGNKHHDDEQSWEKRQNYEYRTYSVPGQYPPGWNHGKKTGWGNCGMPPGQAKKYGCRTYVYEGRPYYYYQNEGGAIIVRRPIISIQGAVTVAP